MDSNKNGKIDENEAEGSRRYFVSRLAERAGMEMKLPLSISKVRDGLKKHYASEESSSGSSGSSSSGSGGKSSDPEPLVPAFGVEKEEVASVLAFGVAATTLSSRGTPSRSSTTSSSGDKSSSSSSGGDSDDRMRRWAESMIRQNDRNHNGRLEKDEWGGLRGDPKETDRNHDGVITLDEMTARLNRYRQGSSSSRYSSRGGSSGSRSSGRDSDNSDGPKSYRFRTPIERLPDDLPDWFVQKDADGDGQVAMAEYAIDWSTFRATEFVRYDRNNDGVITPSECLAEEENPSTGEGAAEDRQPIAAKSPAAKPKTQASDGMWDGW